MLKHVYGGNLGNPGFAGVEDNKPSDEAIGEEIERMGVPYAVEESVGNDTIKNQIGSETKPPVFREVTTSSLVI